MKLNLGVVDIPYAAAPGEGKPRNVTTGDVAGWLEQKYHPMEIFYEETQKKISKHIADSLAGALENALVGAPTEAVAPFAEAESAIADEFRQFITLDVMATLGYPGVPTRAALEGRSSRFKKGKANSPRPSFVDTGLYVASMRSWIE